jgi:hypothetical protein
MDAAGTAMSAYEFMISLRLRHPTIDPATITQTLGIQPQHTWKAGDTRRDHVGGELAGEHRESYWMARLMEAPELSSEALSVESVLMQTLAQLRRSHSFLEQLTTEGGVAEVHVSLFARENFRLDLPAAALTSFGRLGFAVALDIHPHSVHSSTPPPGN